MRISLPVSSLKDIIILVLIIFFLISVIVIIITPGTGKMTSMLSYYINNFINLILH